MSSNDFSYYYNNSYSQPPPPPPLGLGNNQIDWNGPPGPPQRRYFNNKQSRGFHPPSRRYNNPAGPAARKRTSHEMEQTDKPAATSTKKPSKKKKKSAAHNAQQNTANAKKCWSLAEAQEALNLEREFNKGHKNQLIIKFPDLELNKDIVSEFNEAIENVHFQQPSTARFCFVTLKDTSDADSVISALNRVKFGEGFLSAEYKRDREEDQTTMIGPEDIDPFTLYVGNLAQEITKEDVTKIYPNCRRIDIGYAKKMKYTRYAFVAFKAIADSMEAFRNTHNTQMHSKSLIVRFRRIHGTVALPGEVQQRKQEQQAVSATITTAATTSETNENQNQSVSSTDVEIVNVPNNDNADIVKQEVDEEVKEETQQDQVETQNGEKRCENIETIEENKEENMLENKLKKDEPVSVELDGADADSVVDSDDSLELNDVLNFSL